MRTLTVRLSAVAALTAMTALGSPALGAAAPAFDPNNDGSVTVREVLDAPLLPSSLAPALDYNGDGALSIEEARGIWRDPSNNNNNNNSNYHGWCPSGDIWVPCP
ncbi:MULTISPECIES: EF-hand domain-containing protein [Rhodococcus]|uniref:EF-hand domain-containing protein n=1 Tax=Rhodococcus cercidiphylli TaxID=489916 RepID=A0ABU4AXJ5_9NOCA|nr:MULTISPECIES: hypothetical protein [Rhodococcus]KAA0927726.1 hypothetical protein FQ188_01110 [Rhodococcus sp. ANT_H53B]MDV6230936.1 hypothetical protein [Rhodococcus cercidiphylli]